MDKLKIGKRIRRIRNELGLTMAEFGEKIDGVKSGVVSNWENGKQLPNKKRLKSIADLAEIPVNDLLYGSYQERVFNISKNVYKEFIEENDYILEEQPELKEYLLKSVNRRLYYALQKDENNFHEEKFIEILKSDLNLDIELGTRDLDSITLFAYRTTDDALEHIMIGYDNNRRMNELEEKEEINVFLSEIYKKYTEINNFIENYRKNNNLKSIRDMDK